MVLLVGAAVAVGGLATGGFAAGGPKVERGAVVARTTTPAPPPPSPATRLEGRVGLVLGAADPGPHDPFQRAMDLARGPAGRLFIADARANEVRVFRPDGRSLGRFDGRGDRVSIAGAATPATGASVRPAMAPFQAPTGLAVDARGALWVQSTAFVDVFHLEEAELWRLQRIHREDLPGQLWIQLAGARAVGDRLLVPGLLPPFEEGQRPRPHLLEVDAEGRVRVGHGLPPLPVERLPLLRMTDAARGAGWSVEVFHPLAGRPLRAVAPDGGVASVLTDRYEIFRVDPRGRVLPTLQGPDVPDVPFSPSEVEELRRRVARAEARGVRQEGSLVPERMPPVRSLAFDDAGRLWVELTPPDAASHRLAHVYDPQGTWIHEARWPASVDLFRAPRPLLREDEAWGVRVRPDGREDVVRIDWILAARTP